MKKFLIGMLLVANLVSLQYHESIKHKRDNFALCGSSIGASYAEKTSPENSIDSWTDQINQKRNLIKKNANNSIKEIIHVSSDNVNLFSEAYRHNDIILISSSIFEKTIISDRLFSKDVLKPS